MGYKLYPGDCLDILRDKPGESVQAVITDPPYGIDYQANRGKVVKPKIANDKRPFIWWLYDAYRVLTTPGVLLCFVRWDVAEAFRFAIELAGFRVKSQIVWDKQVHTTGDLKGTPGLRHELIWFATKGRYEFQNGRPVSVIEETRLVGNRPLAHPNEKPVGLMEKLVKAYTRPGDVILDPFMGSGSTGVAAVRLGRHFLGIELDPVYYETAAGRIASAGEVKDEPEPSP